MQGTFKVMPGWTEFQCVVLKKNLNFKKTGGKVIPVPTHKTEVTGQLPWRVKYIESKHTCDSIKAEVNLGVSFKERLTHGNGDLRDDHWKEWKQK